MQPSEFGDAKLVEGFVEAQGALDTLFGGDTALRDAFWLATGGLLHFGQIDFEQKPTANDEEVSQVAESSKAAIAEAADRASAGDSACSSSCASPMPCAPTSSSL